MKSFSNTFPARDLTDRKKLACYGVGLVSCPELLLTVDTCEFIVIVHCSSLGKMLSSVYQIQIQSGQVFLLGTYQQ